MTYDNSYFLLGALGAEQPLSNNEVDMQSTIEDLVNETRLPSGYLMRNRTAKPLLHWLFHYTYLPGKQRDVFDGGLGRDALWALYNADAELSFFEPSDQGSWNTYAARFVAGSWQQKIIKRVGDTTFWDVQFELVQTQPGPFAMNYSAVILREPKLLAYYRLGEASGATAADSSGNGSNGTYSGTVGYSQPGALSGDPNTAILFNGTDTTISIPNVLSVQNNSFSFEAWFNPTSMVTNKCLLSVFQAFSAGNVVSFNVGRFGQIYLDFVSGNVVSANGLVTAGKYWHIVGTFNSVGGVGTMYLNGAQVAQNTGLTGLTGTPASSWIGNVGGSTNRADGLIDEVAIYSGRVLSASDVARHYAAAPVNLAGV